MDIYLHSRDALEGISSPADEAERRQEALMWYVLPAILNVAQPPPLLRVPTLDGGVNSPPPEPAAGWRTGRGTLCAATATIGQYEGGSVQEAEGKRICVQVDAGELGTIGVVVEHTREGLRLILAVESAAAEAAADLQKTALVASLRASGLNVTNVRISRADGAGTVLADLVDESMTMRSSTTSVDDESSRQTDVRRAGRASRRLDTTG